MKTLYLVRHGKGAPRGKKQPDRERPLSKTGKREVKALSHMLQHRQICPDVILCAPTERADQTAAIIGRRLACAPDRIIKYAPTALTDPEQLLHLIRSQADTADVVILVGHHPALSAVAQMFAPHVDAMLRTSSVVGLRLTCDAWADASPDAAYLMFYDFPARVAPKVLRHFQRLIDAQLDQMARSVLAYDGARLPSGLEDTIRHTSRLLAQTLMAELRTSRQTAASADLPEPATDETPSAPVTAMPASLPDQLEPTPAVIAPKTPKRAKTKTTN